MTTPAEYIIEAVEAAPPPRLTDDDRALIDEALDRFRSWAIGRDEEAFERVATGGFNLRSFHGRRRLRAFGY